MRRQFGSDVLRSRPDLEPEPRGLPEARAPSAVRQHEAAAAAAVIEWCGDGLIVPGPVRLPGASSTYEHLRTQPQAPLASAIR